MKLWLAACAACLAMLGSAQAAEDPAACDLESRPVAQAPAPSSEEARRPRKGEPAPRAAASAAATVRAPAPAANNEETRRRSGGGGYRRIPDAMLIDGSGAL